MSTDTIVAALATALFGGPAITTFLALRAGWRWADLDAHARRRMVQHIIVYGLTLDIPVGVVALIAAAVLDHPAMPIVSGVVVAFGLGFWVDRSTRGFDAIHRHARALEEPETAPAAVAELLELAAARTADEPMSRSEILGVAVVLGNAGYDREALPLLESLDATKLDPHERELHALGLLDSLLAVGALGRARKALAEVPFLAEGSTHALVLPAYEAQLLLQEGKPREALALVAESVTDRRIERGRHIVRAHACAALGNVERCNESLGWLQAEFGASGLRRVLTPEGPASELARGWLGQRKGPYRG